MPAGASDAITAGIHFIGRMQQPDGSFESSSSRTIQPFQSEIRHRTTFAPALILHALCGESSPAATAIRNRLSSWLLRQKSPAWSFNYWAIDSPARRTMPYPDDLDDTFCALIALYRHDRTLIDETCLAHIVKLLVATESQVGGPYRTWLVSHDAPAVWQDIDLAVNCNIARFLGQVAQPLPNLTALMDEAIGGGSFMSPYYPSSFPVIYYLAQAYRGVHTGTLAEHIISLRTLGWWGTPLQTALAITALCEIGYHHETHEAATILQQQQQEDGSWLSEAFCLDPSRDGATYYHGAAALTTAFVIEALTRSTAKPVQLEQGTPLVRTHRTTTHKRHHQVLAAASEQLQSLSPQLRVRTERLVTRMSEDGNLDEIVQLPALFADSLLHRPADVTEELLIELGVANLFGWTAYTIFDDFLDDEGQPARLPVATVSLRQSLRAFQRALPANKAFQQFVIDTFDTIDAANTWEVEQCRATVRKNKITITRLPHYSNRLCLADRSMGHLLTPLGVAAAAGHPPASVAAVRLRRSLRHYLAARQLHDDAHDWQADIEAGHLSYAVTAILRALRIKPGTYDLTVLMPRIRRTFWRRTLPMLCNHITAHLQQARQAAKSSGLIASDGPLLALFAALDAATERTIAEQTKAERFLAAYKNKKAP
jgi:hypothetical protein